MKMAPVHKELKKYKKVVHKIIHTGQHYDNEMSGIFFNELELPKPNIYLGIGSMSHARQTAQIMLSLEKVIIKEKPDLVIVYGDVNSTIAAGLVCAKIKNGNDFGIPLAHVESGLRSNDKTMPEEINRILTDNIVEYLFVTEKSGYENLIKSGFKRENIYFCGNTMIDSLIDFLKKTDKSKILKQLHVTDKNFAIITLHRPSNVDNSENLKKIISIFKNNYKLFPDTDIIFSVHPRTLKMINKFKLREKINSINNLIITGPLGYIDFLKLMKSSKYVLTDSGGIQEETTYLKIPCITLRENTERPITVSEGTNIICGIDEKKVNKAIEDIEKGKFKKGTIPKFWDGKSADRIVKILLTKI